MIMMFTLITSNTLITLFTLITLITLITLNTSITLISLVTLITLVTSITLITRSSPTIHPWSSLNGLPVSQRRHQLRLCSRLQPDWLSLGVKLGVFNIFLNYGI